MTIYWATAMLSDHRPVCLSVTLVVYCGQTVGRIKMKLGMWVGLGSDHIVLDGDPAPPSPKGGRSPPNRDPAPPKGAEPPNFLLLSVVAKWLDGSRCHLVWRKDSAQATLC